MISYSYFNYCILFNNYNYVYIVSVYLNIQSVNIVLILLILLCFTQVYLSRLKTIIIFFYYYFSGFLLPYSINTENFFYKILTNNLTVGLNNIHPFLYYMGFLFIISYCMYTYIYTVRVGRINKNLYIFTAALVLGMD